MKSLHEVYDSKQVLIGNLYGKRDLYNKTLAINWGLKKAELKKRDIVRRVIYLEPDIRSFQPVIAEIHNQSEPIFKLDDCDFENSQQKEQLEQLLEKYQSVFSEILYNLGAVRVVKYRIMMNSQILIKCYIFQQRHKEREIITQKVKKMVENGVLKPSDSLYGFNIVLVTKHDGTMRPCFDYRQLNKVTIKDAYTMK
jgi:hypothetical protein